MYIKVYNISNTKRFFELILQCKGTVEIVNDDGLHISMIEHGNPENLPAIAASYVRGVVEELELALTCNDDAIKIMRYLCGMKRTA